MVRRLTLGASQGLAALGVAVSERDGQRLVTTFGAPGEDGLRFNQVRGGNTWMGVAVHSSRGWGQFVKMVGAAGPKP